MTRLRVIEIRDPLYHVGTPPRRRRASTSPQHGGHGHYRSYEGTSYSVSFDPEAWRSAIDAGNAETWVLRRRDGKPGLFVDIGHKPTRNALLKIAVARGFARPATLWVVAVYDTELERWLETVDEDKAEADASFTSAVEWEDRVRPPKKTRGYVTTNKLEYAFPGGGGDDIPPVLVADYAIMATLEEDGEVDGIWTTDPVAERGGIFRSKLPEWSARRI